MIRIWYHSMHHRIIQDKNKCRCRYYINSCLISAKKGWKNYNYIDFDIAAFHFRSSKKELLDIMGLKDEKLVHEYLRDQKNNKLT